MNEIRSLPFEFKIPAIPKKTDKNVIPTGKQIPRTPVKLENVNIKTEKHPLPCVPTEKPVPQKVKNCIPKGKEIPRTPVPVKKIVDSLSCPTSSASLSEIDLGIQPLTCSDETDDIDFKIEFNIFKGKINIRERKSKKIVDDLTVVLSEEDSQECENSNVARKHNAHCKAKPSKDSTQHVISKHNVRCKAEPSKDSTEYLCTEMESKCAVVERSQLRNVINDNSTRRNPERRAKKNVNYKL